MFLRGIVRTVSGDAIYITQVAQDSEGKILNLNGKATWDNF